ncbi:MAG: hypothetical protein EB120_02945 [Proteobacteria bacterium]|nr:hypothetical protein [Pseudomonadota bacterium]
MEIRPVEKIRGVAWHHLETLDFSNNTSCAFRASLRITGSLTVDTAKMARVTAICISALIPMIIPPHDV